MTEYWLISAPGEKTCQQTWETMNNLTSKQNSLCTNYKFHIPDLKVGTLDQLVGLSDDLGKLDGFVEQATRKVAAYLGEVLEDQRDKLQENLMANNNTPTHKRRRSSVAHINNNRLKQQQRQLQQMLRCDLPDVPPAIGIGFPVDSKLNAADRLTIATPANGLRQEGDTLKNNNKGTIRERNGLSNGSAKKDDRLGLGDLPNYLMRFQWDIAKYPIKQSLRNIADIISKQVGQIDTDLKTKSTAYNNLKGSLQNLEKKQSGSLLTRNVADLVKKEHFILDSEYLTTLLVIVPKAQFNEWQVIYEKLTDMIVPRSSQMITQDSEYGLFTISLFKKVVDEFKVHAREKRFIVRDFTYNEEELAAGKNEITKLVTDKKKQFGPLVRWLKVNFSECFCAWIHVKALRVFVESVLRYGLPVNFQAILIHPNKKTSKRLRDVLNQLYIHLDGSALQGSQHLESVDIPGLGFGQSEYFPYVYYKINVDMIDSKQI